MNKITIFCLVILFLSLNLGFSVQDQQEEEKALNINWNSIFQGIAELQVMCQDPIEDLVDTIKQIQEDLKEKKKRTQQDFDHSTNEHNGEVKYYKDQIDNCNLDISDSLTNLESLLKPQKQQLEKHIQYLNRNIDENIKFMDSSQSKREYNHKQYVDFAQQHQDAIQAVHECIVIMMQLDEGAVNFAQIQTKFMGNLDTISQKIKEDSVEGALVKSLLALKSEKFSDEAQTQTVINLLKQIAKQLQNSLEKEVANEEKEQKMFEANIKQKDSENAQFANDIMDNKKNLESVTGEIDFEEKFVEQRKKDVVVYQQSLEQEELSYQEYTNFYNQLIEQFESEEKICEQAINTLENGQFSQQIQDRLNKEMGSGLTSKSTVN